MDKIIENKRGLKLVTSRSSDYKASSEKFLVSYVLSEQVWWCNINCLLNYSKHYICNLCKLINNIINYSTSIYHFVSEKCWKEGKTLQKFEYLENEKSFFDKIKNTFHSFWKAIIWWKNKKLIKNSGRKL